MTDMRATERLLEVIETMAGAIRDPSLRDPGDGSMVRDRLDILGCTDQITAAITELRRRGDTLVRRDDLLALYEGWGDDAVQGGVEMLGRIENALGGRMR